MTARARFAGAALLSAALHALVIYGVAVPVPRAPTAPPPLEAQLAPLPAPPATAAPTIKRAREAMRRAPRRTAAPAPPSPTVAAPSPFVLPPDEPADVVPAEAPEPVPAAPEPPPQQQIASAPASLTAPAVHTLPKRGRITYTLFYGNDRFDVGKAVQSWEVEADSYLLASDAETTGIVEFFRPQRLRYLSQGKITAEGLRPESFLASRTRRGQTDAARARFDWAGGHLVYGHARERNHAALPAGTQDIMSFLYQFALVPPAPGRLRLPITNGSRFETYEIDVFDEELIETPIGTLKALPVKQARRAGEESLEFWLASEYRYLPVRIRHYDRDGNFSGEQVVSEIRVSED